MSLYKQLWLSIAFLMSIAFVGSFIVSCLSAKNYLEEQLYRKNLDNASSLALSLSSNPDDLMAIELFISAQYDSGHYQYIRLVDTKGNTIAEQVDDSNYHEAPQWLIALFPINVEPGIAHISNGWQQVGTLTLSSQTRFAYKQLWDNAQRLFYYFLLVSIVGGALGSLLLKLITQPLVKTVMHAQAIGERRFITTAEPKTKEFREVIKSMNKLSASVKSMLDEESSKLEKWRKDLELDKITGLFNREPILNHLRSYLQKEDSSADGSIILIRIHDLFHLNTSKGRPVIDAMLKEFGKLLTEQCSAHKGHIAGRLNGSDFILLLPSEHNASALSQELHKNLTRTSREVGIEDLEIHLSSTDYHPQESMAELLSRADGGFINNPDSKAEACVHIFSETQPAPRSANQDWQNLFTQALQNKQFTLQLFPVYTASGSLLHWEAPVRLIQQDGSLLSAGQFIPHISRLGMGAQLDLTVAALAIEQIAQQQIPIGINLSASLLTEPAMIVKLAELIKSHKELAHLLWLEVPEYGAFQHLDGFRMLCNLLKPLNCRIGIEHVAQEVAQIGELHDLGLDYVKIDRALIRNIDTSTAYQVFLRGFSTIIHSIGLKAIAEGVETEQEWNTLIELGLDGGTGSYFS